MSKHTELPKEVLDHEHRVGKLARYTARALGKDERAAYLAGVFHDDGKRNLPDDMFSGREITSEEYEKVKHHPTEGYEDLKDHMPFCALVAGLHHEMSNTSGYGISLENIPKDYSFHDLKRLLDIATIVSICDFADAWDRGTRSYSLGDKPLTLSDALASRYPNESQVIETVLSLKRIFKENEK